FRPEHKNNLANDFLFFPLKFLIFQPIFYCFSFSKMYPACGQPQWSELLCCLKCKSVFSNDVLPVNLGCGHLMCTNCTKIKNVICPLDKNSVASSTRFHYINGPILAIVSGKKQNELDRLNDTLRSFNGKKGCNNLNEIESILYSLTEYLYKVNSERGATVSSNRISRTIQRKLLSLLCANLLREDGREQIVQTIRSMGERIISELVLHIQSNSNLSSSLWNAVRSRGCQFLGPALQEDVLKLVTHMLGTGVSIQRKTLVMYVVQELQKIILIFLRLVLDTLFNFFIVPVVLM
ncbi:ROQ_II domain-containing protein, partial [Meloidogyne graminicola]